MLSLRKMLFAPGTSHSILLKLFTLLYSAFNSFIVLPLLLVGCLAPVEVLTLNNGELLEAALRYLAERDAIVRALGGECLPGVALLCLAPLHLLSAAVAITVTLRQLLPRQPLRRLIVIIVLQRQEAPNSVLLAELYARLRYVLLIFLCLFWRAGGLLWGAPGLVDDHFPLAVRPAGGGGLVLGSDVGLVSTKHRTLKRA